MTSSTAGKFNSLFCSPKSSDMKSKVFVFAHKLKSSSGLRGSTGPRKCLYNHKETSSSCSANKTLRLSAARGRLENSCKWCRFTKKSRLILESFNNSSTNPRTFLAYFPQTTGGQLLMIQSSAKADERREKGRAGGMTLGEGCGVCHQSGKWDLGLVNTHESVWRL